MKMDQRHHICDDMYCSVDGHHYVSECRRERPERQAGSGPLHISSRHFPRKRKRKSSLHEPRAKAVDPDALLPELSSAEALQYEEQSKAGLEAMFNLIPGAQESVESDAADSDREDLGVDHALPQMCEGDVRILTYNIWCSGDPIELRSKRLTQVAAVVQASKADIVLIQVLVL